MSERVKRSSGMLAIQPYVHSRDKRFLQKNVVIDRRMFRDSERCQFATLTAPYFASVWKRW